jgi:hypothetical protein
MERVRHYWSGTGNAAMTLHVDSASIQHVGTYWVFARAGLHLTVTKCDGRREANTQLRIFKHIPDAFWREAQKGNVAAGAVKSEGICIRDGSVVAANGGVEGAAARCTWLVADEHILEWPKL